MLSLKTVHNSERVGYASLMWQVALKSLEQVSQQKVGSSKSKLRKLAIM